ncbi:unnamed protein product [Rotaria sordida]|uniref:MULE transposase domain-containing protein n=1 Tax=Rotaria sordida TaxID=392033 RepID=A0A815AMB2_9BILA|nr:unnamed protein product [Rotaria sordida]
MDSFLSEPTTHTHVPDPERIPAIEVKNQVKIKAATSDEASSSILHSSLRFMPLSAVVSLPSSDSLMRTIRRQRPKLRSDPNTRVPDNLRKTDRGEEFILYEDNEMIIFTTKTNLSLLKNCKHWFMGGTFKVCPDEFYQLFTLHALLKSVIILLVYGLLIEPDDFEPASILSDFESGTIKTIKEVFPNIIHRGCLFHFGQCVWRHIQDNGLSKKYQEDECFRSNVRKLLSLPFVPVDDVVAAFQMIEGDFDDDAEVLMEYFEKTWIGEKKKRVIEYSPILSTGY